MKNTKSILMVAALAALATGSAQAGLINGGFETGDLTGWTVNTGTAAVVSSHVADSSTYLPEEGSFFLRIQAGTAGAWQTITQDITLAAGDFLEGSAAFDWGDYSPYYDGARVRILGVTGAQIAVPYFKDGVNEPDLADLPWTDWSWAAPSAGTYTVEFGTVNSLDAIGSGFGLFDLKQTSVPEPASLALLGVGLVGLGAMRRKQRG